MLTACQWINPVHVKIVFKNNFNIILPSTSIKDTPDFKESIIVARLTSYKHSLVKEVIDGYASTTLTKTRDSCYVNLGTQLPAHSEALPSRNIFVDMFIT
jgi:hypothetical protein